MHASSVPVSNALILARWVRRAERLAPAEWVAAIERWELTPAAEREQAEAALARAADVSGRGAVRDVVISLAHDLVDSVGWFSTRFRTSGMIGEYPAASIAVNAALALLFRDQLPLEHFQRLYGPFADALPIESLSDN